jgi:CBS domain-containing protein
MSARAEGEGEDTGRRIDIRALHTVASGGSESLRLTVYCERRGHTVAIEDCERCDRCSDVVLDPTGHRSHLVCTGMDPVEPSPEIAGRIGKVFPPSRAAISTIMARDVACVRPGVPLAELAAFFADRNLADAPVVAADGRLLGMVARADVMAERTKGEVPGHEATAAGIMKPVAFTLRETAPLTQAAALLAYEGLARLPVVSAEDTVVGMITALDVLRWLARQDGYLEPGSKELADVDEHS